MAITGIEQDTVEEVVRTGRALLEKCKSVAAESAPEGFRHAAIEFDVLLKELEQAALNYDLSHEQ